MQTIHVSKIQVPERQRKEIPTKHVQELKSSLLSKGLLHAVVLQNDKQTLVAGGCRTAAIKELAEEGHAFEYNGLPVPLGEIPFITVGELTPDLIAEAELEENLLRANLHWMEEADARLMIQKLRQMRNPDVSRAAVAREIAEGSGKTEAAEMNTLMRAEAVLDPRFRENPLVKNAKSLKEAFTKVMDLQNAAARADLISRGIIKTEHKIILGDCQIELKKLEAGCCDLILTDPPYGINADDMKKTANHNYQDDPTYALEICKFIIREGFRLLKPRGHLIMFGDIEHFKELREYAKDQAYSAWRTPLIWRKGDEGQAPWGKAGFTRTYEIALFLVKGEKGLKGGGSDIKDYKRPPRGDRSHAAEKPVALLSHLISLCCDPGDTILDPTCGSGPILEAANEQRVRCIAIEKNPDYHSFACARLTKAAEAPAPQVAANGLLA